MTWGKTATDGRRGYTLIEVLVAVTIIGILFGIGYVNFRDFSRRQALAGAGKLLLGDLRLAQQQAASGQKPADPNCNAPANTLTGYFFNITSTTEYKIYAGCSAGVSAVITKDIIMPPGITVSSNINPILFKVLGSGTSIPQGSAATITLTQANTSNTFKVIVGAGGEIQ